MQCKMCGSEDHKVDVVQGERGHKSENGRKVFVAVFTLMFLASAVIYSEADARVAAGNRTRQAQMKHNKARNKARNKVKNKAKNPVQLTEKLRFIKAYQAKYFQIIKRRDILVQLAYDGPEEFVKGLKSDHKELEALFEEVKGKITNKNYLNKYIENEKRFSKNPGMTTRDMEDFAYSEYKAVDDLLNEVYKAIKAKIPRADFEQLKISERKWIKEVANYRKVFDAQGFGSISGLMYAGYQVHMRQFRTLLLMLYL